MVVLGVKHGVVHDLQINSTKDLIVYVSDVDITGNDDNKQRDVYYYDVYIHDTMSLDSLNIHGEAGNESSCYPAMGGVG